MNNNCDAQSTQAKAFQLFKGSILLRKHFSTIQIARRSAPTRAIPPGSILAWHRAIRCPAASAGFRRE